MPPAKRRFRYSASIAYNPMKYDVKPATNGTGDSETTRSITTTYAATITSLATKGAHHHRRDRLWMLPVRIRRQKPGAHGHD